MKIFITGASGFIGSNIVKILSNQHQFYAMARSEQSVEKVKALGATPVRCDLGNVTVQHLQGCELIIHAAAFTKEWGTREEFWRSTVHGTRQLVDTAKQAGIKKFIHISTEAVLFTGQDLNNIDERYPYPTRSKFLYSESKLEAEKLVLNANIPGTFEVVAVRPRLVWGPGDQTVLPIIVDMVNAKKFMWVNRGTNVTSTTHIYNLAEGIRCLINHWKGNQVYFITDGETHTYREFLTRYLSTRGVVPPDKNIAKGMIRTLADITEFVWKTLGLKSTPPVTRLPAYMLSSNFTISHQKASQEINYQPVISVEEGMKELDEKKN
jgi:nucleoside-diphosphate-sugar epimerase